ncbi:hypothetical protein [Patulibacter sp. SYSU D01012]|uniref:hypothetical protein n=1 Tax=Patulibacter sp. SYSU D01012 TaxID=2817381 RepID=UPI001B301B17|nr:hypothetical protein [Patulibacter sp. SYSU D01012]
MRGFYTVLGWVTWRAAKWYLAKRLGLARKARRLRLVLTVAAVGGGAFAASRRLRQGGPTA